ncbi:MAG: protein kinase [Planctomycetes bacterium]|nr:protein kinase [Planctomycetota bacterium]
MKNRPLDLAEVEVAIAIARELGLLAADSPADLAARPPGDVETLAARLGLDGSVAEALLVLARAAAGGAADSIDSGQGIEGFRAAIGALQEVRDHARLPQAGPAETLLAAFARAATRVPAVDLCAEAPGGKGGTREDPPIGRYRQPVQLGAGGMGVVLSVLDPDLRRTVALKVVRPDMARSGNALGRLVEEAQITGQLEHPNIVPVHELGVSPDGRVYFAMKLVRGTSLADLLRALAKGRAAAGGRRRGSRSGTRSDDWKSYPLSRRLTDFLKVCDAVSFAHSKGVVHRDLKPANVMIGEFGEVLVMDWGLARVRGLPDRPGEGVSVESDGLAARAGAGRGPREGTRSGDVLGTLYYMPPEQADGRPEDVDERSDVYSLGATLCELLTLLPPVSGATAEEILTKILRGEIEGPAERTPHRGIPRELDAVVRKAMAFDPGERYESVETFRQDLEAFLEGRTLLAASYSLPQVAAKWLSRHRVLAGGSVAAVLAAVLLAGYVGWRDRAASDARAEAAVREAEELLAAAPAFQEDGIGSSVEEDAASAEAVQARRSRETALEVHLAAVSALGRALAEFPDDARIRALRRRVGEELGRIALAGKDYTLARQSFRDLADHGASAVEVEALLEEVDRVQTETLRRRAERLRAILADVASEDFRRGRSPGRANIEDHVFEAAGYREIQTVSILAGALAPLVVKGRQEDQQATWTESERDVAVFACRVLGRLGLPESVAPLSAWLSVLWDQTLAIEAGRALCDTREASALPALLDASDRIGADSHFWSRVVRGLERLPDPGSEAEPRTAGDFYRRAIVSDYRGEDEKAMADYDRAIALDGAHVRALGMRALRRRDRGDVEGALADLERALAHAPGDATLLRRRGNTRLMANDLDGALADMDESLRVSPDSAETFHARAVVLVARGETARALSDVNRALRIVPASSRYLATRASVRLVAKDFEGALEDAGRALDIDPYDTEALRTQAVVLWTRGDLAGALHGLDRAVAADPADVQARLERGRIREERGDPEGAAADYDEAISLAPANAQGWWLRGLLRKRAGDLQGAVSDLTRVLGLDPSHARAYFERGQALVGLNLHREAIADFKKHLELMPDSPAKSEIESYFRRRGE